MSSLLASSPQNHDRDSMSNLSSPGESVERGRLHAPSQLPQPDRESNPSTSPMRKTPTSADIDAVIAAAMASAPPPLPPPVDMNRDGMHRAATPLMTNLLPAAVGADGRVNLFVGNLPYRVRWQDLKDLFRKAGTVLRADVSLGPDNRSRGYGTVLMGSREDGARAIDRFNGYTWQTRTLEVRPDRLPPEYEAQPHINHPPSRPPPFNYHANGSPFPMPGQVPPPGNGQWPIGPLGSRPQSGLPVPSVTSQHIFPGLALSGIGYLGTSPLSGNSPMPSSLSPSSLFGSGGLPLPAQHAFGNIVASPLAGSLTSGSGMSSTLDLNQTPHSRDSNYFSQGPVSTSGAPQSSSPNGLFGLSNSRPSSSEGKGTSRTSPVKGDGGGEHQSHSTRAPPPGHLGPLPPNMFAGVKAVISPDEGNNRQTKFSSDIEIGTPGPQFGGLGIASQQPFGMAPLGPSTSLGEPSTLRDRVVFVSDLPMVMQWQELRDLLRPAGTIIRADVATGPDGRPRGFGTALFASEQDAASAVTMFNDREIGGHKIRVHLDLHKSSHDSTQGSHRQDGPQPVVGFPIERSWSQPHTSTNGSRYTSDHIGFSNLSLGQSSNGSNSPTPSRLPWPLNTGNDGPSTTTPARQLSNDNDDDHRPNRQTHHPGPISMPPFPSLGNGNPLSPLQGRGLPPMTPSMPGFVFHAYPQTPPIHPQFLSPGLGPFSPGQPVTSPNMFSYNPFLNAAPGAPVNRYPQGGSAALDTPTTQSFPSNPVHGFGGAGAPGGEIPSIAQTARNMSGEGDYFPSVLGVQPPDSPSPGNGYGAQSRASMNASPLNAKDRLAPSAPDGSGSGSSLADLTKVLTVSNGGVNPSSPPTPTSKSNVTVVPKPSYIGNGMMGMRKSSSGLEISDLFKKDIGNAHGGGGLTVPDIGISGGDRDMGDNSDGGMMGRSGSMQGRTSLDNPRPNLGVWNGNGERRASWGDIGRPETK